MSLIHTSLEQTRPETLRCKRCNADLPPSATFCGHCGERVEKQNGDKSSPKHADITSRYRITSLLRKQLPTQILLARDNQQQRPVVIHEIDISNLDDSTRIQAIAAVKSKYDLLRKQRIPGMMPLIDLYYFNAHLSIIASWPFSLSTAKDSISKEGTSNSSHYELSTLQDLLQSGLGLPDEQLAITWVYRLSAALEQLHHINIVLGDLDPQTILMSQHNYQSEPLLVGSWLPDMLRKLFPVAPKQAHPSSFYAPEALIGNMSRRSDIYSLGAILYLLLTGITPSNAHKRIHYPLPSLHELNIPHSGSLDMVLMQALALEQAQRYQSVSEFMGALQQFLPATKEAAQLQSIPQTDSNAAIQIASNSVDTTNSDGLEKPIATTSAEEKTGPVVPLQARMARRYLSRIKTGKLDLPEQSSGEAIVETKSTQQDLQDEQMEKASVDTDFDPPQRSDRNIPENNMDTSVAEHSQDLRNTEESPVLQLPVSDVLMAEKPPESSSVEQSKQRRPTLDPHMETSSTNQASAPVEDIAQISTVVITSHELEEALAAHAYEETQLASEQDIPAEEQANKHEHTDNALNHFKEIFTGSLPIIPRMNRSKNQPAAEDAGANAQKRSERANDLLKRVQHFILGEPQQTTSAAALIETPMRIQPNQGYTIRINVIGRNNLNAHSDDTTGGLSALVQGDEVHIEVRSALYQNYAYIVQQADVSIPATGFVAEVTMPMKPLSSGPSGRRERLHIFFMDDNHNPLYEKPFVIEVFISHLVQNGREGHNVLSIPL
jgi:serine/threonine protein kinase